MNQQSGARESPLRSILKAVAYRITGTVTTAIITFAVTGELVTALAIGSIEPFVKLIVYYVHERAWQRVPIGTIRRIGHLASAVKDRSQSDSQ